MEIFLFVIIASDLSFQKIVDSTYNYQKIFESRFLPNSNNCVSVLTLIFFIWLTQKVKTNIKINRKSLLEVKQVK